jgi:AAHS family 4-hydroxybenzoate transporter-like MFS transporter
MFCGFNLGMAGGGFISAKLIPAFGWHSLLLIGGILPLILAVVLLAGCRSRRVFWWCATAAPTKCARPCRPSTPASSPRPRVSVCRSRKPSRRATCSR